MSDATGLYLRPIIDDARASSAFDAAVASAARAEVIGRLDGEILRVVLGIDQVVEWASDMGLEGAADRIELLTASRAPFAGLAPDRPRLMGVVNVTPDSFSDGGLFTDPEQAVDHGLRLIEEGADIIDVGGESTRPGATPVTAAEEMIRVLPVVRGLVAAGVPVSIDTRHAEVMRAAIDAGATVVNDVTALTGDSDSLAVVRDSGASVVLMHMRGDPRTMQQAPTYDDVVLDVFDYLERRLAVCLNAGIPRARIAVDPGIGFGKSVAHNLELLRNAAIFHGLGCVVLYGLSRKSFIGKLSHGEPPSHRVPGSIAAGMAAVGRGIQLLRVHDVAATTQALAIWRAIAAPDGAAENS